MAPAIGLSLIFSIQCTLQHRVCLLPGAFTCFHPCSPLCRMPLAAVGYLDGTLAIYDLSTQSLRHKCQHEVQPYLLSLGLGGGLWACWRSPSEPRGQFPICTSPLALGFPKGEPQSLHSGCAWPGVWLSWGHGDTMRGWGHMGGAKTCWRSPLWSPAAPVRDRAAAVGGELGRGVHLQPGRGCAALGRPLGEDDQRVPRALR